MIIRLKSIDQDKLFIQKVAERGTQTSLCDGNWVGFMGGLWVVRKWERKIRWGGEKMMLKGGK